MKYIYFLLIVILISVSNCVKNPEESQLPQVAITYPPNGAYVIDAVMVLAEAVDNIEIKKVEFYIDGVLTGNDTVAPYTHQWVTDSLAGNHTILAKAYDNDNNFGLSNVITVSILDTTDTESPQIAIVSPGGWSTVSDTVQILTSVSDNRGVSRVIFYIDGDSVATDMTAPFNFYWNTCIVSNNYHTILTKAVDFNQNWTNAMITVLVQNPDTTDTEFPQIAIISPAGWSTVSDTVRILTEASDNRGVSRVVFYIDGDSVYTNINAPFSFDWNSRTVSNDYHTILAKAFDFSQNWANSMITVVVQNQ